MILARILCLLGGYALGIIQTAYIYGKANGIDIREHGSGNAGTTNALRVLGKKAGLVVFLGDFIKAVLATTIARIVFYNIDYDNMYLYMVYAGLGTALGHNFPFYMKFKGGKGIAVSAGFILGLLDPVMILICLFTFVIVLALSKYVSLGSICLVTVFAAVYTISAFCGRYCFDLGDSTSYACMIESSIVVCLFSAMAIIRHRANIVRLIRHEENKFSLNKK